MEACLSDNTQVKYAPLEFILIFTPFSLSLANYLQVTFTATVFLLVLLRKPSIVQTYIIQVTAHFLPKAASIHS
jgi:hypothetical protein